MQQPLVPPIDTLVSAVPSLVLRLTADGFVYLYGLSGEEKEAGTQESCYTKIQSQLVPVERSRVSALWGDIIAQHPLLSDPEGAVHVLCPAFHYVVIPSGMSGEQDVHWRRLVAPTLADEEQYYSNSYTLDDGKPSLVVGFSHLIKGFLQCSLVTCQFIPAVLLFAQRILRQSSLQTEFLLGVELVESGCDLVLCQSGNLLRVNYHSWPHYCSWQHHPYQVLYFLSKVYLDSSIDHAVPVSIILSDGTAGVDGLVGELLQALYRQFTIVDWDVSVMSTDYQYA